MSNRVHSTTNNPIGQSNKSSVELISSLLPSLSNEQLGWLSSRLPEKVNIEADPARIWERIEDKPETAEDIKYCVIDGINLAISPYREATKKSREDLEKVLEAHGVEGEVTWSLWSGGYEGLVSFLRELREVNAGAVDRAAAEYIDSCLRAEEHVRAGNAKAKELEEEAKIKRAFYRATDMPPAVAVAEIVSLLVSELVTVRVSDGADVILNMSEGERLQPEDMRKILKDEVMPSITSYRAQLEKDSDEEKAVAAIYGEAYSLFKAGNLSPLLQNVANAIRDAGRVFKADRLNMNPYLVGVGNEVLDLKAILDNPDGDLLDWLRPVEYEDAVTKSIPVDTRAGLKGLEHREKSQLAGETSTETLIKAIHPDDETRRFVQKALGYSLFGQNKKHKFFVWFGPGGSGKGSLFDCVMETLGEDYVSDLTPEQFKKGSASKPDPDYAASLGTRMTFVNETEEGMQIDAAAIKRGTETRKGRPLYSNETVKYDGNTVTVMTNRPFVFNHDSGVERRLAVIRFEQPRKTIRDAQPNEMTEWRKRDEEKVWFLRWLLEGFALAMTEGLETEDYPPEVAKATREFIEEADPSARFFSLLERTGDPEDFLSSADMAEKYREITGADPIELKAKALSMKISRWFKDQGRDGDKAKQGKANGYRGWVFREDD